MNVLDIAAHVQGENHGMVHGGIWILKRELD
jgi:hypothetical protein